MDQDLQKFNDLQSQFKIELLKLNHNNEILQEKSATEVESLKQTLKDAHHQKSEYIAEIELNLKHAEEKYNTELQKWKKYQAIYQQKQEFFEAEVK